MIHLANSSIVSVYCDLMAVVLVLGLAFLYRRYPMWSDQKGDYLFRQLCVITVVNAISNGISYALHHQQTGWPTILRLIMPTIAELSTLVLLYVWILYIEYNFFHSWDRVILLRKTFGVLVVMFTALCVINFFTGIMFSVDENMLFVRKPLYYCLLAAQYAYGIIPVIGMLRFMYLHGRPRFFHITPVVIPAIVAALFTNFTEYSVRAAGFAMALVFLHLSYANRWRFCDTESGFYNRHYLKSLEPLIRDGKRVYRGAVVFLVKKPNRAFYTTLRTELPKDAELIRKDEGTILLFTESGERSTLEFLASMMKDAVEEYEEKQENASIGLTVCIETERAGEKSLEFMERVMKS